MYKPTYHTLSKRGYITLLALLVSIITFAQGVTVKGTVLDENQEPLIGATVQVKGESTGAAADLDGNFTLKAKKNAYIGSKLYRLFDARSTPARQNAGNYSADPRQQNTWTK